MSKKAKNKKAYIVKLMQNRNSLNKKLTLIRKKIKERKTLIFAVIVIYF